MQFTLNEAKLIDSKKFTNSQNTHILNTKRILKNTYIHK